MFDQVNALQQFNRRILNRLRPVGLAELGLADAIAALTRLWRETHPGVVINTSISPSTGALDETAEVTIYRIIQEALTNVFRHAGATRVDITVARTPSGMEPAGMDAVRVSIRDDGAGLQAGHKLGFGIIGMRERVQALGGTMTVESTDHGVAVEAMVPGRLRQSQGLQPA